MRPNFITDDDIKCWDTIIDSDINLPAPFKEDKLLREVIYAGQWLASELLKLGCDEEHMTRIAYTAGGLCFGRDPWEVHQNLLDAYKSNQLEFEQDTNLLN